MYTYQMIGLADENGRTYTSKYGTYSKDTGFILKNFNYSSTSNLVNKLFHEDCWSLDKPVVTMTKEEIEQELGYKIKIKDNESHNTIENDFLNRFCWLRF